jgi:hypothetical protein
LQPAGAPDFICGGFILLAASSFSHSIESLYQTLTSTKY